ncbi:MAG: AAA family ATPase [Pseudomonadota bacterium]
MNVEDNEHAVVHELRGFIADDLEGAFKEAEAISLGTQCRQYLFSLSLNPPPEATVPIEVFEKTIGKIEARLGLTDQPRAVVFHEKLGRRHAHCVWSRIDPERMRAINLPHFKRRLQAVARELYRTHGWEMPAGFEDARKRDVDSFDRVEAAQAKKVERDPKALKRLFRECWDRSDSTAAFAAALREHGFILARGSRRAFVAVDAEGQVFSLSRWTGAGAKALRDRLGLPDGLPSIDEATAHLVTRDVPSGTAPDPKLADLISRQREERVALVNSQAEHAAQERADRQRRLPSGLKAMWARLTGQHGKILERLEKDAEASRERYRRELEALIARHLGERRALSRANEHERAYDALDAELDRKRLRSDPRQRLILQKDDAPPSIMAVEFRPETVLDHLSSKAETFTTSEIDALLSDIRGDRTWRERILQRLLSSPDLVRVSSDLGERYTTRSYLDAARRLQAVATDIAGNAGFAVAGGHVGAAITAKNARLKATGASLSNEQIAALQHLTAASGLACVVGYAGAGKSTLLEAARQAWKAQGLDVHGLALSGKAADGLEDASGIPSRTLASLETSWKNGHEPVSTGSVVVIDEVGMVGTRQLDRILSGLAARGCKAVLVGDPDQLQPIEAGAPFRDLLARHEHVRLREIRRQTEDWQRAASVDLAEGRLEMAVRGYADRGFSRQFSHRDQALSELVEDYVADIETHGDGASRLALAHRRRDVFALNQAIRASRAAAGALENDVVIDTDHGPRAFAIGDRILLTRNDALVGVRNGMLGTVRAMADKALTIDLDGKERTVILDLGAYRSFDHGYAVTIHKSQGCTVDRSFAFGGATMDRHLTYVAMTRHRSELRLYREPAFKPERGQSRQQVVIRRQSGPRRTM